MKCIIATLTISVFILVAPVSSFSETRQEQLYRLAGIKTEEQKTIDKLTTETENLKKDISELRLELEIIQERIKLLEIRTSE
jgi:peptidoglycan hydrolase CwlO-like protein